MVFLRPWIQETYEIIYSSYVTIDELMKPSVKDCKNKNHVREFNQILVCQSRRKEIDNYLGEQPQNEIQGLVFIKKHQK